MASRTIVCDKCKKEIDFRVGFGHDILYKHYKKEHK